MIQPRQRYGFGAESLDDLRVIGEFGPQHFNRDFAVEHDVNAAPDRSHAAFADLFEDFVIADQPPDHFCYSSPLTASTSRVARAVGASLLLAAVTLSTPTVMLS